MRRTRSPWLGSRTCRATSAGCPIPPSCTAPGYCAMAATRTRRSSTRSSSCERACPTAGRSSLRGTACCRKRPRYSATRFSRLILWPFTRSRRSVQAKAGRARSPASTDGIPASPTCFDGAACPGRRDAATPANHPAVGQVPAATGRNTELLVRCVAPRHPCRTSLRTPSPPRGRPCPAATCWLPTGQPRPPRSGASARSGLLQELLGKTARSPEWNNAKMKLLLGATGLVGSRTLTLALATVRDSVALLKQLLRCV